MATEVKVPALGESIVEATVSKWLKQEGDAVAAGEPLVELETDKVNLEVPADQSGVLASIRKAEGETVNIGDLLGVIDEAGTAVAPEQSAPPREKQPDENGHQPAVATGETARVVDTATNGEDIAATPVAQRVAVEHDLDIRSIKGSGPGGRVTKEDVLAHLKRAAANSQPSPGVAPQPAAPAPPSATASVPTARPPAAGTAAAPPPVARPAPAAAATGTPPAQPATPAIPPTDGVRSEERVRMTRRRQTIARRLVEAQQQSAMLTTFNEIDMSAVMALRQRRKQAFKERHGINLGFMSFFTRAVVSALKAFPLLNAEIQANEIVLKHYYDIGIAVGTDEGLVVPVVRDADRKNFAQIEHEIAELAGRARDNTLTLAELQGGTFTITNGGIYGSLLSTPILNTPQVGILGMHKIEERPIAFKGEVVIRPMMYVALSYDHRIVDGSEAVRFLARVKELVEDPEALLLE